MPKRWELWSLGSSAESAAEVWKQQECVRFANNVQFWHISMVSISIFVLFGQLKNNVIFTKNSNIMYNVTNCLFKLNVSQRFFVWKLSLVNTVYWWSCDVLPDLAPSGGSMPQMRRTASSPSMQSPKSKDTSEGWVERAPFRVTSPASKSGLPWRL